MNKNEQDMQALKCGDKWVETDRLFVKWNGEPMQSGTPYFWLGEFCEKHDLPFYGLHSFRHLFASLLVNQGVDIVTVSGALGHCNSGTTSTDVGMAGPAMLSAVGYCFTGLYRLAGKADHTEPLVVNSLTVAEPSFKKSPVMSFVK